MTDTTWVHDLDPFLIQFSGNLGIRWYGLAYVTGFICCFLFMKWFSEKKITPLSVEQASDFLTSLILGVLIGGRVGYALFYAPELLTDFRPNFPFWGVFAVWEGGMASHGGFLGVWIACAYFAWKNKIPFPHLGDLTIVGAMIGIGLGRFANFINGELMGKVCDPNFIFAVKFPQDMHRWLGYDVERLKTLQEPARLLGVSPGDWARWSNNIAVYKANFYDIVNRIISEIQVGNTAMVDAMRPLLDPRHPSQIYASFTEAWIPLAIIMWIWRKPRKPGLVGSLYIIIYAFGRIFNEQFRLPDAHIADLSQQPLGISRGQFISLFMILAGVAFLIWSQRRDAKPLGGWAQKTDK